MLMRSEAPGSVDHCISARDYIHLNAEAPDGLEHSESLALNIGTTQILYHREYG